MPTIETYLFIGACHGFRPVRITYSPPSMGSDGSYVISEISDKYELQGKRRLYDVESTSTLNDINLAIGRALQARMDGPPKPPMKKTKKKPTPIQQEMNWEDELP